MATTLNTLVDHWLTSTTLSTFDILNYLLSTPNSHYIENSGFVLIKNTPLANPQSLLSRSALVSPKLKYKLCWLLIHHPQCYTESMYAYLLDDNNTITTTSDTSPLLARLRSRIQSQTSLDLNTTLALSARRFDLQVIVLAGFKVLLQVHKSPENVACALHGALVGCGSIPHLWKINLCSSFFEILKQTLVNASIAFHCEILPIHQARTASPQSSAIARLDGDVVLHVLNKDKYLLIYLLAFASPLATYLTSPLPHPGSNFIPSQLASFFSVIYHHHCQLVTSTRSLAH